MRNPLIKRIPKELKNEWHKYLVIIVFMVVMIGVISGMYVGHDSMLYSVDAGKRDLILEDGSFELEKKASKDLLDAISTGDKADVRQYFIDKGMKEADKEVAKAIEEELDKQVTAAIEENVRAQCALYGITDEKKIQEQIDQVMASSFDEAKEEAKESEDYKKAVDEAYDEAHEEVEKKVDEEWDDIADRYNLNDPDFEAVKVTIYENFYREADEDKDDDGEVDANVRVFKSDAEIDKASFNEGRAPETEDEIAIDRMHADNVGISIGDTITVDGKEFKVVGLLSYVNYLTLHESNTDLMFDAFGFDVAMVTPEGFNRLKTRIHYSYAYLYDEKPQDKIAQADHAENFLKALITQTVVNDNEIEDYLPEYLRQASNFAPSDIEGDSSATSILCYILIGVIAFIFAITISNTIDKEASVIGTLRASGYSKRELIVHYMSMPLIVTIIGAVIGNVLGYTAFKNVAVNLYYESYSLPTCHLVWSNTALIKTTIIPLILMFCINLFVIVKKLQLSPLRFLRHDLVKSRRTKARRLPRWSFMRRFRLRILFQNMPNYLVLIFGVIFIELMMCFAFGLPDSLNNYSDRAADMMFAEYQYMLMDYQDDDGNVIETSQETAERFSITNLLYEKKKSSFRTGMGSGGDESVSVYGVADDSEYVALLTKTNPGEGYVSSAFASKFGISAGDTITLHEEYENKSYDFKVVGEIDYEGGIALFMNVDSFNEVFDKDEEEFSGFFARDEITDIDDQYIATVITKEDILKVTVQLKHSLGGVIDVFKYALIVLAAALIYLLAKIIIERNEGAISMVKILGFSNNEIASLYMLPTAIVVTLCAVVGFGIGYYLMTWVFKTFMMQMDGYFAFYLKPVSMVLSVVYLLIGYVLVSVVDYLRIKRIPMDVALKNVE
ncbi:ABC transporter permease [Butyrivibrio proteoclasticus]|uniref:ABC transporter permease n=1 Tax=Butyrivibrio proteoclasticus TaxID=43305 RepID=UPI00047AEFAB|nr:ABC transporter permease [Butyrivibrio proteoclasticus]